MRRIFADIMAASPQIGRGHAPMDIGNVGAGNAPAQEGGKAESGNDQTNMEKLALAFEQLNAFV